MRGDGVALLLIPKMPPGDALGDTDSCMNTLTVHTYKSATEHKKQLTVSFVVFCITDSLNKADYAQRHLNEIVRAITTLL